jgi:hypothetical protein
MTPRFEPPEHVASAATSVRSSRTSRPNPRWEISLKHQSNSSRDLAGCVELLGEDSAAASTPHSSAATKSTTVDPQYTQPDNTKHPR